MKKFLIILCVLILVSPMLMSQERTGTIYGKVLDEEGTPLPGVSLVLTGQYIAPITAISSATGSYRFVALPPASDYTISATLQGFKRVTESNIIVRIDSNVEINIEMQMGELEEEVTVTATTPVVDIKTTRIAHNVNYTTLQSLPSARDPWVVAQMAPGVLIDRENVGGSESGQQSDMIARGSTGGQTTYNIDGMNITDPDAIGASPGYYDFDSFEEIDFTVGGGDVTQQQAGVNLNIVTRRGGNRISVGGRLFWTESGFQAKKDDLVEELKETEVGFEGVNSIRDIKDYGVNMGGPVVPDKLWAWGYYGVQDIRTTTVIGVDDDTYLQNMGLKLNAQVIPENRAEIMFTFGKKNKWGRSASLSFPGGYFQDEPQHFGNPIHKFQDEHMFGDDLFLSFKYVYANVGFSLTPMDDLDFEKVPWYDETAEAWIGPDGKPGGYRRSIYMRPVKTTALRGTYYNDDFLGAAHEILFGLEYNYRSGTTTSEREGHMDVTWNYDWGDIDVDFDGDGNPDPAPHPYYMWFDVDRYTEEEGIVKHYQAYLRDTISFGRFTLLAGFRFDIQQPYLGATTGPAVDDNPVWDKIATPAVRDAIDRLIPATEVPAGKVLDFDGNDYFWQDFSPRLGLTWDITGDGKTIAKFAFNRFSNFMDIDFGENWYPAGLGGTIMFWWDDDGDLVAEMDELFWANVDKQPRYAPYRVFDDNGNFLGDTEDARGEFFNGYDPDNPLQYGKYKYTEYDKDVGSNHTTELTAALERELMPDLSLSLVGTWRRYDNYYWDLDMWLDDDEETILYIQDYDMYVEGPPIPAQIPPELLPEGFEWDGNTGEAAGKPWYFRDGEYDNGNLNAGYSTDYELRVPRPDYWNEFYGVDVILNKRLSKKWMLNASFTYQWQRRHWGDKGVMDRSNEWALDGRPYSGSVFSPWMFKASGVYQAPYGINISFFFNARQGWRQDETFQFANRVYSGPYNRRDRYQTIYIRPDNELALPTFYKLDFRVEKMFNVSDTARIWLMADFFNITNVSHELRRNNKHWGRYYYYGEGSSRNSFTPEPRPGNLTEILVPFVARFGIRFQF